MFTYVHCNAHVCVTLNIKTENKLNRLLQQRKNNYGIGRLINYEIIITKLKSKKNKDSIVY